MVITSHGAFNYLGQAYGLHFLSTRGLSAQADPSARDLATLITLVRQGHASALFLENISDPRLLRQIAAETGANVAGTLHSDALSGPEGPAATYLALMQHNTNELAKALGSPTP